MDAPSRTQAIDEALASLKSLTRSAKPARRRRRPWTIGRIARIAAVGVASVILPFLLIVKVSVALYLESSMSPWLALGVAAVVTTLLLTLLTMGISFRVRGRLAVTSFTFRSIGVLVASYCIYAVLFISASNLKSAEVAETYRSLHPLLRLGVSTLVLADDELVVTDAARAGEDYATMGLPVNQRSLHFVQNTDYVHAVDLRTVGRSAVRNAIVAGYFSLMGFDTLRHVGTADHLHVSLPVR